MPERSIKPLTRFAPSPTGGLHLGHAMAAREAFGFARSHDGTCLLRIEDIDHTRCKPEYTEQIYEDLRWLGFDWPDTVRVQSRHMGDYEAVAETLREMGVLYPCALSRKEVAARSREGVFRGEATQAREKTGDNPAWRLSIPKAAAITGPLTWIERSEYSETGMAIAFETLTDDILVRRDIGTSYLIACSHDDHMQGITHVVRGTDLRDVTPYQRIIQALMGWDEPTYLHHDLVMDGDKKLSKRDRSTTLKDLRESGMSAGDVWKMVG